jgi:hypothetical protein
MKFGYQIQCDKLETDVLNKFTVLVTQGHKLVCYSNGVMYMLICVYLTTLPEPLNGKIIRVIKHIM